MTYAHNEVAEQKIFKMTLQEFREYVVPEGWKLMHVSGYEHWGWPGPGDRFFEMSVTIERLR